MEALNIGSTPPPPPNALTISDGKTLRAIWQDGDGNGDPSIEAFEASRHSHAGHPTWKVYCGDAPKLSNGVVVEPPRFAYLDDAAAARVLAWPAYTRPHRARCWRFDFASKGELRPRRANRGRPALAADGAALRLDAAGVAGAAYVFAGGPRADLETLAAMRASGLLEHRGVALPDYIPGPAARVVHSPRAKPAAQRAAVGLAEGVKRRAEEDPFGDGGPRTPTKKARADSEDSGNPVIDGAYYQDLTNRLYTLNAYAAEAMDKVHTIDIELKKVSEEVTALKKDQERYLRFFENLEHKVARDSKDEFSELIMSLSDDELLADMDRRSQERHEAERLEAERKAADMGESQNVED